MNFGEYLISMVGDKKATEILSMNEKEKANIPIMITGKQGATGKTTLKRELDKRGYLAIEAFGTIGIVLDKELPVQIKNFAVDTDEEVTQFWRRFKSEQIPEIEKFMKEKNLTIADIKKLWSLFNNDGETFLISSFEWKSFNKKIADLEGQIQSQQEILHSHVKDDEEGLKKMETIRNYIGDLVAEFEKYNQLADLITNVVEKANVAISNISNTDFAE